MLVLLSPCLASGLQIRDGPVQFLSDMRAQMQRLWLQIDGLGVLSSGQPFLVPCQGRLLLFLGHGQHGPFCRLCGFVEVHIFNITIASIFIVVQR